MSRLVFSLPVGKQAGSTAYVRLDAAGAPAEHGTAQLSLLPRSTLAIGVWPAEHTTLLAVTLPPMPPARLQAALAGTLEDRLLGDISGQHFAAGPRGDGDGVGWVACCERSALARALADADEAWQSIDRVVPEPALLEPGWACLQRLDAARVRLLWRDAQGEAAWLHLDANETSAVCPQASRLLVEPGLEELARHWFGDAVELQACDRAQWLARAAACAWDMRQFELAPRAAAQRLWSGLREQAATPAWRRAGILLGLLGAVQLIGLNVYALQLRHQRTRLESQLQRTVQQALPGVPAILDPSLQMGRALNEARQRVGAPTGDGLEVLMGEAADVLGGTRPTGLEFAPGQLQLRLPAGRARAALDRCTAQGLTCSVDGNTLRLQSPG